MLQGILFGLGLLAGSILIFFFLAPKGRGRDTRMSVDPARRSEPSSGSDGQNEDTQI